MVMESNGQDVPNSITSMFYFLSVVMFPSVTLMSSTVLKEYVMNVNFTDFLLDKGVTGHRKTKEKSIHESSSTSSRDVDSSTADRCRGKVFPLYQYSLEYVRVLRMEITEHLILL